MARSHRKGSARQRILVVDDHDLSRRYAVAALRQSGVAVKAEARPDAAFRLALDWQPQAIFVDLRLPGTHGFEWMDRLYRAWPAAQPRPRLIVLSACRESVPAVTPAGTPIDASLHKPATPEALRRCLLSHALPEVHERRTTSRPPVPSPALRSLFHEELADRLCALDQLLAERDLARTIPSLHRLIASARICQAGRLEAELAALRDLCRGGHGSGVTAAEIANRYYAMRAAAAAEMRRDFVRSG